MTTRILASAKSFSAQWRPSTPGRLKSGAVAPGGKVGKASAPLARNVTGSTASRGRNQAFIGWQFRVGGGFGKLLDGDFKPPQAQFFNDACKEAGFSWSCDGVGKCR